MVNHSWTMLNHQKEATCAFAQVLTHRRNLLPPNGKAVYEETVEKGFETTLKNWKESGALLSIRIIQNSIWIIIHISILYIYIRIYNISILFKAIWDQVFWYVPGAISTMIQCIFLRLAAALAPMPATASQVSTESLLACLHGLATWTPKGGGYT